MKFFRWLKRNAWAVAVAFVTALGAGIFWAYHRGRVRSLEVQVAVEKAHARVAALDAERSSLEERREANAARIEALEEEKRAIRAEAVALEEDVEGKTDDEIERAFGALY
jgi:hypothetical protein